MRHQQAVGSRKQVQERMGPVELVAGLLGLRDQCDGNITQRLEVECPGPVAQWVWGGGRGRTSQARGHGTERIGWKTHWGGVKPLPTRGCPAKGNPPGWMNDAGPEGR